MLNELLYDLRRCADCYNSYTAQETINFIKEVSSNTEVEPWKFLISEEYIDDITWEKVEAKFLNFNNK